MTRKPGLCFQSPSIGDYLLPSDSRSYPGSLGSMVAWSHPASLSKQLADPTLHTQLLKVELKARTLLYVEQVGRGEASQVQR